MSNENKGEFTVMIADELFVLPVSRRSGLYTKHFLGLKFGSIKFVVGSIRKDEDGDTRFSPFDSDVINAIGMDKDKLMKAAIDHMMEIAPLDVLDIVDAIDRLTPAEQAQIPVPEEMLGKMIIVTNKNQKYGSVSMLYPGALKNVSDTHFGGKGFYILPSSLHEVICVPDDGTMCSEAMQMMVIDINRCVVDPEDYMSDQVYYYNPVSDDVSVEED